MATPSCVMNPLTTVRIPRLLTRPGDLMVRAGESVEPSQIVAQSFEPADFRIVDVARELEVPVKNANALLKVQRGQAIAEGDILAARGGLSRRVCRAPISGTVVGVGRGRLLLEGDPEVVRLAALVPGYVVEARGDEGVVIETIGGLIEALWGNGKEAYGVLRMVVRDAQHPIRVTHINASSQGTILVGGATVDEESIAQAASVQVRGMIIGSLPASLISRAQEAPFPIVATEGIGTTPMTQTAFALLRSLDGRDAAVSGDIGARWREKRPYIVVPMPTQAGRSIDASGRPAVGDRVRVLRGDHRGQSGTIAHLLEGLVHLETGARMPRAAVTLAEGVTIQVPYANLERLL